VNNKTRNHIKADLTSLITEIKIGRMVSLEEDLDLPELSAETFSALAEFYKEQEQREMQQMEGKERVTEGTDIDWKEDWQLSQFWYSEETASKLARAIVDVVGEEGSVACVSAPTLYRALKKLEKPNLSVTVFEFDNRFAVYGSDFQFYDYKSPLDINRDLREKFDLVFADPPFLSEECLTKTMVTVKFLSKGDGKVVLCTGAIMADLANRLGNLKVCQFTPVHQNSLSNPFQCFSSFDLDNHIPETV